jgi:hypothetical protein
MTNHNIMTIRDNDFSVINGTSLQGYVDTTYDKLVETFGEPTTSEPSGDDKVQYEWVLRTPAGVATVYDWKNYGRDGKLTRDWHIGGHDKAVVALVQAALR